MPWMAWSRTRVLRGRRKGNMSMHLSSWAKTLNLCLSSTRRDVTGSGSGGEGEAALYSYIFFLFILTFVASTETTPLSGVWGCIFTLVVWTSFSVYRKCHWIFHLSCSSFRRYGNRSEATGTTKRHLARRHLDFFYDRHIELILDSLRLASLRIAPKFKTREEEDLTYAKVNFMKLYNLSGSLSETTYYTIVS